MLKKLFKSKRESELILEKELLEIEIEKLKNKIRKKDGFLKCKNNLFIEKDNEKKQEKNWQDIEKKLKKYYTENKELKEIIKNNENIISISCIKFNYLIQIEKFLYETRFKDVIETLKKEGNNFAQNLSESTIDKLSLENTLKLELKKKINKLKNLEINWEMKTHLLKGEKLSKIYLKHRKFLNIILKENREFISDLDSYNFDCLINFGYSLNEIQELKKLYQDYVSNYRIEII